MKHLMHLRHAINTSNRVTMMILDVTVIRSRQSHVMVEQAAMVGKY